MLQMMFEIIANIIDSFKGYNGFARFLICLVIAAVLTWLTINSGNLLLQHILWLIRTEQLTLKEILDYLVFAGIVLTVATVLYLILPKNY